MTSITRSGRGKAILLGEHAVVFGSHALVIGLDAGVDVEAAPASSSDAPRLTLYGPDGRLVATTDDETDLSRALSALLSCLPGFDMSVRADFHTRIPTGVGLGSSAALAVATARALSALTGAELEGDRLLACANAAEAVFHSNPSGVDVAAAAFGGVLQFRRGEPPRALDCPEPLPLVVARISEAPPTRVMVDRVGAQQRAEPARVGAVVREIDDLALRGTAAIASASWGELGAMFDRNHDLLVELGVSTDELDSARVQARQAGALGAKLTGAGGGGCLIALAPGCQERVASALRSSGADIVVPTCEGRTSRPPVKEEDTPGDAA